MNELEIPEFDKGDIVKDKFGNLLVIEDMVSPQHLERDSDIYDFMGYRVKIIEKNPSSPTRMVGNVSGFHSDDKCMWIYNTREDAVSDEVVVTDAHIFATELELYDEDDVLDAADESDEVPRFAIGDLVKDKFSNFFKLAGVYDAGNPDNMRYKVALVDRNSDSPVRCVGSLATFNRTGDCFWIYNTLEDAKRGMSIIPEYHLLATELELVKPANSAKADRAEKAEIAKRESRYPSIEVLQKMSEENDLGKLLDLAYEILKEQASLGERRSNLEAETFKRCIPHFEREGFDITEHGTLIEVRW